MLELYFNHHLPDQFSDQFSIQTILQIAQGLTGLLRRVKQLSLNEQGCAELRGLVEKHDLLNIERTTGPLT